jgi:transposase InsO family protein
MVEGLPQINFSKGECSTDSVDMHPEGKLQRGKSSRASGVLQMVHMVLVGPFAFSQGHYILTFVDDFSRFTWVYFLHNKNEVLDKFLDFKTHVERKSRKAIKVLQMDNGSMYVNIRLKEFCRHEGIDLQTPPAFSPHKTNVAALRI